MTETKHLPDIADVRASLMDDLADLAADLDTVLAEAQAAIVATRKSLLDGELPSAGAAFPGPVERMLTLAACAQYARTAAQSIAQMGAEHVGYVVQVAVTRRRSEQATERLAEGAAR